MPQSDWLDLSAIIVKCLVFRENALGPEAGAAFGPIVHVAAFRVTAGAMIVLTLLMITVVEQPRALFRQMSCC
jgi:hypothetical protein